MGCRKNINAFGKVLNHHLIFSCSHILYDLLCLTLRFYNVWSKIDVTLICGQKAPWACTNGEDKINYNDNVNKCNMSIQSVYFKVN